MWLRREGDALALDSRVVEDLERSLEQGAQALVAPEGDGGAVIVVGVMEEWACDGGAPDRNGEFEIEAQARIKAPVGALGNERDALGDLFSVDVDTRQGILLALFGDEEASASRRRWKARRASSAVRTM